MLPLSSRWRLGNDDGVPVVWDLSTGRAVEVKATAEGAFLKVAKGRLSSMPEERATKLSALQERSLTSSWMYWMRKGEALRLSTGKLKKPWISFW